MAVSGNRNRSIYATISSSDTCSHDLSAGSRDQTQRCPPHTKYSHVIFTMDIMESMETKSVLIKHVLHLIYYKYIVSTFYVQTEIIVYY